MASSDLRILTWNLYLGADAARVLGQPAAKLVENSTLLWNMVRQTDFPARAVGMAAHVRREQPDVIALQEVYRWTHRLPDGRMAPGIDFLALLQEALGAAGLDYEVVVNRRGLSVTLPLAGDRGAVNLEDGVCLLVKREAEGWRTVTARAGDFQTNFWATIADEPFEVRRGWCAATLRRGVDSVIVVNTHLEAYGQNGEPLAQVEELLAGPIGAAPRVVATGDFNLELGATAIQRLLSEGFRDAWIETQDIPTGATSCQPEHLLNHATANYERIDYVFTRGLSASATALVAATPEDGKTPGGLWLSDHAALVADLRIDRAADGEG